MASIQYARKQLKIAGEQIANRTTVVTRQPLSIMFESAHASQKEVAEMNRHAGTETLPSHRYTGPSERMNEDDPHQAAYAICLVEKVLAESDGEPDQTGYRAPGRFRVVFEKCYIRGEHPGNQKRAEYELASTVAGMLGETDEDGTIAANAHAEWRLSRLQVDRARQAARQRQIRLYRKAALFANAKTTEATKEEMQYKKAS